MSDPKPINPGNHPLRSLNDCNTPSPIPQDINDDVTPGMCVDGPDSLNKVSGAPDYGWLDEACERRDDKLGKHGLCDPMQTGQILNDVRNPTRNTVYRYSQSLRGCDMAMKDMFSNLVVLDGNGTPHPIPIIWGSQERAVMAILGENIRRDKSLVVDRIRLPMLSIHQSGLSFAEQRYTYHKAIDYVRRLRPDFKPGFTTSEQYDRDTVFGIARGIPIDVNYTLDAWTLYLEDMNQIVEQVLLKFSKVAYIRVRGVQWETVVKLESTANNLETEPGDQNLRVIKWQFNLVAETYIPQPIIRRKAVLKTVTDFFNAVNEEEITEVIDRLEDAVEELE